MVEGDQYCIDILTQTSAVHKALEKVDVMILENHLETCVTTAIRSDDPTERERVLRELVSLFQGNTTGNLSRQVQVLDLKALGATAVDSCC